MIANERLYKGNDQGDLRIFLAYYAEDHETGNQLRRRKGNEMRAGLRPYPTYPAKKVGPNFDENGKYIYPPGSGFNYMERLDPNSEWGGKVS